MNQLRFQRRLQGLSQWALAEKAGVSSTDLQTLETRNYVPKARRNKVEKALAAALGFTREELFEKQEFPADTEFTTAKQMAEDNLETLLRLKNQLEKDFDQAQKEAQVIRAKVDEMTKQILAARVVLEVLEDYEARKAKP